VATFSGGSVTTPVYPRAFTFIKVRRIFSCIFNFHPRKVETVLGKFVLGFLFQWLDSPLGA
jgi:hypothetical protein